MRKSPFLRLCGDWPKWAVLSLLSGIAIAISLGAGLLPWPYDLVWLLGTATFLWWTVGP